MGVLVAVVIVVALVILILMTRPALGKGMVLKDVPFREQILGASQKAGVDPCLVAAVVKTESSFRKMARREEPRLKDASIGLMQVLLKTARDFRPNITEVQLFDPQTNLDIGSEIIAWLSKQGVPLPDRIDAYNIGIGAFQKGRSNLVYRDRVLKFMKEVC